MYRNSLASNIGNCHFIHVKPVCLSNIWQLLGYQKEQIVTCNVKSVHKTEITA